MKKINLLNSKRKDENDFERFLERNWKGIEWEKKSEKRKERIRKEIEIIKEWLLVSGIFCLLLLVIEIIGR